MFQKYSLDVYLGHCQKSMIALFEEMDNINF